VIAPSRTSNSDSLPECRGAKRLRTICRVQSCHLRRTPDAWIVEADTRIGYAVSCPRHFYQPPKLRTLAEISADILALEQETEGLLSEITKGATA